MLPKQVKLDASRSAKSRRRANKTDGFIWYFRIDAGNCYSPLDIPKAISLNPLNGAVAEWSKAHAWKVCRRETVSRVRIPVAPPPHPQYSRNWHLQYCFCVNSGAYISPFQLMYYITSHIRDISSLTSARHFPRECFPCFL